VNALAEHAHLGGGVRSSEIVGGDLRLVLNNTIAAVEDGRQWILERLEPLRLGPAAINRLEVIFEEVIANIVRHGFEARSDHTILVLVATVTDAIVLTFEDDGIPFNPLEVPEPQPFTSIETAKIGGLGVPLVRRLSTNMSYQQVHRQTVDGRALRPCNRLVVSIATG
jgi:serine/threonine-protein kinase RsbW